MVRYEESKNQYSCFDTSKARKLGTLVSARSWSMLPVVSSNKVAKRGTSKAVKQGNSWSMLPLTDAVTEAAKEARP